MGLRAAVPGPSLCIVVLAAGFSRRLGRPKALARIHGVSLLLRTVRMASVLRTGRIVVVLPPRAVRARAELRRHRVEFAESRDRVRGLSASVHSGLKRARCCSAALLLPVDLPLLDEGDLSRLIARWQAAMRVVAARRVDGRAGAPLILPRRLHAQAFSITGDLGLRHVVNGPACRSRLIDLPQAALDVDTEEDLRQVRRSFRG